jgi:hypothetical protein
MASVAEPTPRPEPILRDDLDTLARVIALGGGAAAFGSVLGAAGALLLHAALAYRGFTAMIDLGDFAARAYAFVLASRPAEVDVDVDEAKP